MRSFWMTAYALLCLSLAACGGGGGGGGSSSTPAGAFTLSGTSANFTALQGSTAPANSSFSMNITGKNVAYVGAAYTNGQTQPSWLGIDITGSGSNYQVVVSIRSTNLQPTEYSSTFGVGTADSNGNILQSQMITVRYTVTPRVALSAVTTQMAFAYGGVQTSGSLPFTIQAPNITWTATSNAAWLTVPTTPQTGNSTLNAAVDTSTLAPGSYSGRITITDTANPANTNSGTVSLQVERPLFSVLTGQLVLGGADGLSATTLPLTITISSPTNRPLANHTFSVVPSTDSGGTWLRTSVASGAINSSGVTFNVSAQRGSLAGGTYTGMLTLRATVKDVVLDQLVPITYHVEASRIVVGAAGVGLSSSPAPARSVLTRSVPVYSSIGRTDVPWQASSNQSWLNVTASGTTGQSLTLTADPSGRTANQTHFATVTITSSDPLVENQQTIRVGLHVNSAAPATVGSTVPSRFLATSPTEPLAFFSNGGTTVTAYNVYTGALVRTFTGNVDDAGQLVLSGDGRRLYVFDRANVRVAELDAVTGTLVRHYSAAMENMTPDGRGLSFFRPAGYSILVAPGHMYDVDTGREYQTPNYNSAGFRLSLTPSIDQTMLADDGGNIYRLQRTALAGGAMNATYLMSPGTAQGRQGQACITPDLQAVYTASGSPYNFPGTYIANRQPAHILPGTDYPNAILCLWNGIIVGGVDGYYYQQDIWVYDGPSGQLRTQLSSSPTVANRSLLDRGLAASADGTRLISLSEQPYTPVEVKFQSLPDAL